MCFILIIFCCFIFHSQVWHYCKTYMFFYWFPPSLFSYPPKIVPWNAFLSSHFPRDSCHFICVMLPLHTSQLSLHLQVRSVYHFTLHMCHFICVMYLLHTSVISSVRSVYYFTHHRCHFICGLCPPPSTAWVPHLYPHWISGMHH